MAPGHRGGCKPVAFKEKLLKEESLIIGMFRSAGTKLRTIMRGQGCIGINENPCQWRQFSITASRTSSAVRTHHTSISSMVIFLAAARSMHDNEGAADGLTM